MSIRACNISAKEFEITDKDQAFYAEIAVPAPTLCPDERMRRRMAWCNEGVLYKNKCALTGKNVISQLSPDNPRIVYSIDAWWSDDFNPLDYGREIDWSRSIMEQLSDLEKSVPHACVSVDIGNENSDYTQSHL